MIDLDDIDEDAGLDRDYDPWDEEECDECDEEIGDYCWTHNVWHGANCCQRQLDKDGA